MKENTLSHLLPAVIISAISIVLLAIVYPLVVTGLGMLLFPWQANGSMVTVNGKEIGSAIIGQLWSKPEYFQGRPSAAGKGYDPTSTGATNYGATSKKLIDATTAAIAALKKANPDATGPIPPDLVSSSASGIDPDISPEGAEYQVARIAEARHIDPSVVRSIVAAHTRQRTFGFLGEPRVNVLELNEALDLLKH